MNKSINSLKKDISTLRTGRANTNMLDTIKVDVYGQLMPIDQIGTISVPEARLISVQVWDKANIALVESAIQKSELGINPQIDGQIIRLRIPDLTEEGRKELIKVLCPRQNFKSRAVSHAFLGCVFLKSCWYENKSC